MKQPRPDPVGHEYNQSSAEYRGPLLIVMQLFY
jgi:hypothetical protein